MFSDVVEVALTRYGYTCTVVDVEGLDIEQLVSRVVASRPDAVLANIDLDRHHGPELLHRLASRYRVIAITEDRDPVRQGEALARGAYAVLPKISGLNQLFATVRKVLARIPAHDPITRGRLLSAYRADSDARRAHVQLLSSLSPQEATVLGDLMSGHSVAEIAKHRLSSEHTVRAHTKSIRSKLQVATQLSAVAIAHGVGWQPPRQSAG